MGFCKLGFKRVLNLDGLHAFDTVGAERIAPEADVVQQIGGIAFRHSGGLASVGAPDGAPALRRVFHAGEKVAVAVAVVGAADDSVVHLVLLCFVRLCIARIGGWVNSKNAPDRRMHRRPDAGLAYFLFRECYKSNQ